ncbi:MAG: ArsR/SmtB family transcription factor [Caulobacteraceae bacterium]
MGVTAALDRTLAALADPRRRATIDLLSERPRSAGELARAVGLAPPAMSRHLRALRRGGMVEESHPDFDARVRVYALKTGAMSELMRWLERTELLWSEQLAAFKAHVERAPTTRTPGA